MHDVTLVYTEYNHRLEVWVLGKRAANTTADRQQYTNTSKVCDDTMSMGIPNCSPVVSGPITLAQQNKTTFIRLFNSNTFSTSLNTLSYILYFWSSQKDLFEAKYDVRVANCMQKFSVKKSMGGGGG